MEKKIIVVVARLLANAFWGKGVFAVIGSGTPLDKDVSIGKDFLPVANTFWGVRREVV